MKHQSGRSMVEILGVLAIIGVLSVGGLAAYRYAMNKKVVNDLMYDLNLADTEIMTNGNIDPNLEPGDPIELDVFEGGHPKVVFVKAYDFVDGQIILPEKATEAEKDALDAGVLSPYWVHFDALTAAECVALFKSSYGAKMPFVVDSNGDLFDVANSTDAEKVDFCKDAFPEDQVVIDDDVVGFNFSLISSAYAADTAGESSLSLSEAATSALKLVKYIVWDVWGDLWKVLKKVIEKIGSVILTEKQSLKLKNNLDAVTAKGKDLSEKIDKKIDEAKNDIDAVRLKAENAAKEKAKEMKEKVEEDVKGFYLSWPDILKWGKEGRVLGIACDAGEYFNGKKCVKCPKGSDWDINGTPFRMIQKTKVDYARACFCDEETPLYNAVSDECYACGAGTYATKELKCEKCPGGSVRYDDEKAGNALAVFDFAFNDGCKCPKNSYWSDKDDKCMTCPAGSTWKEYRPKDGDIFVPGTEGLEITSTFFGDYKKAEGYACICPKGSYFDTKTSTCDSCPVGTERQKSEYFQKYGTVDFPDTFDEKTNTYCGCPIDRPYWDENADNGENLPKGACVACPSDKPFYDPESGICRACFDGVSLAEDSEIFWDSDLEWYVDDEEEYKRTGKCVSCPDGTKLIEKGLAKGSWFGFSVGEAGLTYDLERKKYPFEFVEVGGVEYGCACSEGYYFDEGTLSSPTCKACDGGKYNPTNNSCDGVICTETYANAVNNGWKDAEKAGDITVTRTKMTSHGIQYVEISSEFNGSKKEREAYRCDANSGGTVCHWTQGCFIYHGEEPTLYCEDGTFPNVEETTLLPEGEMVALSYYTLHDESECNVCPSNAYWISGEPKCGKPEDFPKKMGEDLDDHWGFTDCKYLNARCIACGLGKTISGTEEERKTAGKDDCVCLDGTSTDGDGGQVTRNGGKTEVDRSECRCNYAGQYWDEEKEACVCPAPTKLLSELPDGSTFGGSVDPSASADYESDQCVCPYEGQVWAEISSGFLGLSTTQTCICGEGYCSNEIGGKCRELKDTEYRNADGTCAPCGGSCDSGDCVLRDTREGAENPCISCYTKDSTKPYWDGDSCEPCPADKPKWAEVHADWDFTGLVTSKWQCTECPVGAVYGLKSDGTWDCIKQETYQCTDEGGCGSEQFCLTEGWLSGQSDEVKDFFKNKPQNTCYEMLSVDDRACAPKGKWGCRTEYGGWYARERCGEDESSWYHPCPGGRYNADDDRTLCPMKASECQQCPKDKPYSYEQTESEEKCFSCPANAVAPELYGGSDVNSGEWVSASNGKPVCFCETEYYAVNGNKNCCHNETVWDGNTCAELTCPSGTLPFDASNKKAGDKFTASFANGRSKECMCPSTAPIYHNDQCKKCSDLVKGAVKIGEGEEINLEEPPLSLTETDQICYCPSTAPDYDAGEKACLSCGTGKTWDGSACV